MMQASMQSELNQQNLSAELALEKSRLEALPVNQLLVQWAEQMVVQRLVAPSEVQMHTNEFLRQLLAAVDVPNAVAKGELGGKEQHPEQILLDWVLEQTEKIRTSMSLSDAC